MVKENNKPPVRRSVRALVQLLLAILILTIVLRINKHEEPPAVTTDSHNAVPASIQQRDTDVGHQFDLASTVVQTSNATSSCSWTTYTSRKDCTVWVRPESNSSEGVAHWVSLVAMGHIVAAQTKCQLLVDYRQGIDLEKIFQPVNRGLDWRVPTEVSDCQDRCIRIQATQVSAPEIIGYTFSGALPYYRHVYKTAANYLRETKVFADLEQDLPGFDAYTGFECSLGSLFQLAPTISEYEPRLFTEILPALHQPDRLVLSLYIRSGQTEKVGTSGAIHSLGRYDTLASPTIKCALRLESKLLLHRTRIVWMVVTDAPAYKAKLQSEYSSDVRQIFFTDSRGAHSKPNRAPSLGDFSQAVLDWWLIGEASDAVITHSFSSGTYGDTGAIRKSVPYYKAEKNGVCTRQGRWMEDDQLLE